MKLRPALGVFLAASVAGLVFSGYSTSDFVQHLDRQTHSLHCSFIPGLSLDASGTSGCHAALMSPYSSVLRSWLWGGVPSALAGMAVFAFLVYRGLRMWLEDRQDDQTHTKFLLAATLVPVLTSLVYAGISAFILHELCKVCAGIYLSSFTAFGAALVLARDAHAGDPSQLSSRFSGGILEGVTFVMAPVALYVALAPDFSGYLGQCGDLVKPEDPSKIFVTIGETHTGKPAIELLDPLCPACAAFEERLEISGLDSQLDRKAVLFPLDNTCNWMVTTAVHPGACTISEAVLCADDKASAVLDWAFAHSEEVRTATTADPAAAKRLVSAAFPELASCIGSEKAQQKVNRSLRWAVANQLPVVTPQLYVGGLKVCDEDTDLGLDWALTHLLSANTTAKKGAK